MMSAAPILLTGGTGQVGQAVLRHAEQRGLDIVAPNRTQMDLTNARSITDMVASRPWSAVINCAAYTAVDQAESNKLMAFKVNARGPQIIGEEATTVGASVIHFSSDYVFDGTKKSPYKETDKTNPLSVYGASKLEGEKLLMQACSQSIVLRTSWVVSDQVGVPTSAHLLADVSMMLVNRLYADDRKDFPYGIYHIAPGGKTNWCDFARLVITEAITLGDTFKVTPDMVLSIKTKDYPTAAKRPMNSRLDTSLFERTFSMTLPPWEEDVFAIMKSLYRG